jgi:hypothetical protein
VRFVTLSEQPRSLQTIVCCVARERRCWASAAVAIKQTKSADVKTVADLINSNTLSKERLAAADWFFPCCGDHS